MENESMTDCLLIGHNEMDFAEYEKGIRIMGLNSGAYRDLDFNFIIYNQRPYTISEIYNIFHYQDSGKKTGMESFFHVAESFSAAISYLGSYLDRNGYTFDYVNDFQYSHGCSVSRASFSLCAGPSSIVTSSATAPRSETSGMCTRIFVSTGNVNTRLCSFEGHR